VNLVTIVNLSVHIRCCLNSSRKTSLYGLLFDLNKKQYIPVRNAISQLNVSAAKELVNGVTMTQNDLSKLNTAGAYQLDDEFLPDIYRLFTHSYWGVEYAHMALPLLARETELDSGGYTLKYAGVAKLWEGKVLRLAKIFDFKTKDSYIHRAVYRPLANPRFYLATPREITSGRTTPQEKGIPRAVIDPICKFHLSPKRSLS